MLALDTVSVSLSDRLILDRISIDVLPGSFTALVGPNGAGKSTALAVMAGDIAPDSGKATLNRVAIADYAPSALAGLRIVMRQAFSIPFAFTVSEVVEMGLLSGITQESGHGIVARSLRDAGLTALADRPVTRLSGGESQRVSIARALAQLRSSPVGDQPRYLLLDEPTASLDLGHQAVVMALARQFAAEGIGVIAVLHDLNLASAFADRIVLLANGKVAAQGDPGMVLNRATLSAIYGTDIQVGGAADRPFVSLASRSAA